MSKPVILADTRDKKPWYFEEDEYFKGTARKKVDYGDYSIEGLEDLIFIERKASCAELAKNITEDRFHRLLNTGSNFKYKYIIVECPLQNLLEYPAHENFSNEIKQKIKIHPNLLLAYIVKVMITYDIHIIFAGNAKGGQKLAYRILRQILKNESI